MTTPTPAGSCAALPPTLPDGRTAPAVPKAAGDLVEFADAAGWLTLVQWGTASDGSPFLDVQIGLRDPRHHVKLTWHSFGQLGNADPAGDVSSARLRLFTRIYSTGGRWRDVPSLKALRRVIDEHRAPAQRRGDDAHGPVN